MKTNDRRNIMSKDYGNGLYGKARKMVKDWSADARLYFDAYCPKRCANCSYCHTYLNSSNRHVAECLLANEAKLYHLHHHLLEIIEEKPWVTTD